MMGERRGMRYRRRPRCAICHAGFEPDRRVGDRQRVCGRETCQRARRRETQAGWRRTHAGYFVAWRAKKRAVLNASEPVEAPRMPPPLSALPWPLAQEEFGIVGAEFIASFGRVLLEHAKDQRETQLAENAYGFREESQADAKDQRSMDPSEIPGGSRGEAVAAPKDQRSSVPP